MTRVHMNIRVTPEVLADVDAYASERGLSRSAASEALLQAALEAEGRQQPDTGNQGAGTVEAMQAHITTLHEQLAQKDEQIARLNKTADQAQELQLHLIRALPASSSAYVEAQAYPTANQGGAGARSSQEQPQNGNQSTETHQEPPQAAQQPQDGSQGKKRGWFSSLFN